MFLPPHVSPAPDTHLPLIEGGLTCIVVFLAFAWPRLGTKFFPRIERPLAHFARRKRLSVALVGFSAALLRLALLPVFPIPLPVIPD